MADVQKPSPLVALLESVEKELHLRRRDIEGRLAPLQSALLAYRRALEERAAHEFASSHDIKRVGGAGVSPSQAAQNLLAVVTSLPELAQHSPSGVDTTERVEPEGKKAPFPAESPEEPLSATSHPKMAPLSSALPLVVQACGTQKLVIVGALAGRRRNLPDPLECSTEWIDTSDGGAHALGNVPTRIRQGRIFGVIICDQAILHMHSEPLMAAARSSNVPVGFAGKGGGAGIGRALKTIEERLGEKDP